MTVIQNPKSKIQNLLGLFAFAFALRCYSLNAPLVDYHSWRQADTAAIARNFAAHGYQLLRPQVDWGGSTPGYAETEFPLYSFTLALLYGALGVHEWLGRLLTALVSAAAPAALYALVLPWSGRRAALYAGATLALMPFAVYFGRTVMPDSLMLLAAILALLTFSRWLEQPTPRRFALALLCGALAPLAKTPNLLIVAVPLVFLALAAQTLRQRWPALLLYAAVFALPALLWMWHARALPSTPQLSFGIGEKLGDLQLLRDPHLYVLLALWSVKWIITPIGLPFFVIGLFTRHAREAGSGKRAAGGGSASPAHPFARLAALPSVWLVGVLLFFLVGAAGVVGQDYYILPLAGPAAWLVGIGLARTQCWLEQRRRTKEDEGRRTKDAGRRTQDEGRRTQDVGRRTQDEGRRSEGASRFPFPVSPLRLFTFSPFHLFPLLCSVCMIAWTMWVIAPLYTTADFYRTLGQRVDLALPPGARLGVIAPAVSEILYYGDRKGWRLDPGVLVPGGLASLAPDLGVRYVLVADPWFSERRDVLDAALRDYQRISIGPYALLLDLAQPASNVPSEMVWQTGHVVAEAFLSYWKQAGTARLGLPLSEALDGPEGREQYFERGVLVAGNRRPKRAEVGRLLLEAQGRTSQRTGVAPAFRAAWAQAGGDEGLGAAISPMIVTASAQIQYYEYGAIEVLPNGAPHVSASGRALLDLRGLTEERQIVLRQQN